MKDKIIKNLKLVIFIAIVAVATWVIIIQPAITFKSNEKTMEEAARRYYDLNSRELPTGERVKTIELQKLYDGGLLEKDFFIPLTKKTCSNENSWVKVRRENGVYKYYVYLECGRYKSRVDHVGPVIKLNGKETISIDKDSKYKEQGVESVIDAVDLFRREPGTQIAHGVAVHLLEQREEPHSFVGTQRDRRQQERCGNG